MAWSSYFQILTTMVHNYIRKSSTTMACVPGGCAVADGVGGVLSLLPEPYSQRPQRPQPCDGTIWPGVGHRNPGGRGTLNAFGEVSPVNGTARHV